MKIVTPCGRKTEDLSGILFNRLTPIELDLDKTKASNKIHWKCRCLCGEKTSTAATSLKSNRTKSCGCLVREERKTRIQDLTGEPFGKLTAISIDKERTSREKFTHWFCKCSCDSETIVSVRITSLKDGNTKSCGCLSREVLSKATHAITHGDSKSVLYGIWTGIKGRCFNKKMDNYGRYGGRGITMCDEWKNSYEQFREWALKNGYIEGLSIERNDVNGHYEPSNCCFIQLELQCKNRRNTVRVSCFNETKRLEEWIEDPRCPLKSSKTLDGRLRRGWDAEKAITTPSKT